MASIVPYKPGQPAVQGSQRYRLDITSHGVWKGDRVATMTVPAGTAAGVQLAPWENLAGGFAADNSLSGDSEGSKLRVPNALAAYVQGVALFAVSDGDAYHPLLLYLGRYTGAAGTPWQLPAAGERLTVFYRANESGLDGSGDYLQLNVRTGPLANDVLVSAHLIVDAAGAGAAELNSIKARQTADEARIAALEARPAGSAANLPAAGTRAEAEAGTGTSPLLWTAARLFQAARAAVTTAFLAMRTGGWIRSASDSDNQLHLVHVRADGSTETMTFTPRAGTGGGGITVAQARNAAGSLLSALPEFSYDASAGALTFTEPSPSGITIGQLADALRDLINAKLDGPAVDRRVAASADVAALKRFEDSLRHQTGIAAGAVAQHESNALARLGSAVWPEFAGDDDVTVRVRYGPNGLSSAERTFSASLLRSANQADSANSTNAVSIPNADAAETYWISVEGGSRRVLFASDTAGSYQVAVLLTRTRVTTAFIGDGQVTRPKLAADVQRELDEGGRTDEEIANIADAEAAKYLRNVDEAAGKDVRFTTQFQGRVAGETGIADSALSFDAGGTTYTSGLVIRRTNGTIDLGITPVGSRDALRGWEFAVGDERHDLSGAGFEAGDAINPDLYTLPGPSAAFSTAEDTRIAFLAPPGEHSSVPKGTAAEDGYSLKWDQAGGRPEWRRDLGPVEAGAFDTDDEGNAVITPSADQRPANALLEIGTRLFVNGRTRWIELSEADDVVRRGDEVYPAHVVVPNSEVSQARFQIENYAAPDRADQTLEFNGWTDRFRVNPNTQRLVNYGAAHATSLPPGWTHATYYPPGYPVPALQGRIVVTASPQLVNFAPATLFLYIPPQTASGERTLNVGRRTQRRNGADVFLGYEITPAASDRPSKTGATSYRVNLANASANTLYLTDASSTIQYAAFAQLAPREAGAAGNAFKGRLRAAGNNAWAAVATNADALGGLLRGDFPDGWRAQFVVKLGASTATLYSDWVECEELTALAPLANTSAARVIRRQVLSRNDVPTEIATPSANCLQLAARGFAFLWIGFIGDRLTASSDHASLWTDDSVIKARIKPF